MSLTDRAAMTSVTTGTGTITLGSAISSGAQIFQAPGYDSFVNSGCIDGQTYSYLILDVNGGWEYGRGVYTASGTTLTRVPIRSSGGTGAITLSGNEQVFVTLLKEDIRELLLANRTYYVRSDGSDSNNGFANTAGGAFATLQKAWNTITVLDLGGFTATIKIGNTATLTAGILATAGPVGGTVIIEGDTGTPSNTIISTTAADCIRISCVATLAVQSLQVQNATSGDSIRATQPGSNINIGAGVIFGTSAGNQIRADNLGRVGITGNYTVSGSAAAHIRANNSGVIAYNGGTTVTVNGTPAFSNFFADCTVLGLMNIFSTTYSGAATGTRYSATLNGVINTFGGGATFLPGNVAGTTATGGQYA